MIPQSNLIKLLPLMLLKIFAVASMPTTANTRTASATLAMQTTKMLSIKLTNEALMTLFMLAVLVSMPSLAMGEVDVKAYGRYINSPTDENVAALPTGLLNLSINKAISGHVGEGIAISTATSTTNNIKRNIRTNMLAATTTANNNNVTNVKENILANVSTAGDFMASTIAKVITINTPPTITNVTENPQIAKATLIAPTSMPALTSSSSSSSSSLLSSAANTNNGIKIIRLTTATTLSSTWPTTMRSSSSLSSSSSSSSSSSPSTSTSTLASNFTTNMSFHQHCMSSRDSFADLITIVLYAVVCVIGLFGNTLVIYVVLRFSKMQTVTNIYILNLAIADECFLIGIPFLLYTMRICSWTFGEYICKAYMVSTSITQFTSSIFLLIMSADRFIAVCHPIASPRYRTLHIAKIVSALAWLTSAVLMLPVILFASTVAQEDGEHFSCNIDWPERYKKHSGTTFILYTFFLGFATPLCFILCFYYLVIKKLHAVGRKHKSKEKKRSHRKVTRLVLTVITVYILCWLPQWISQVALISSNPDQRDLSRWEVLIFLLLGCLAYSNSAMNPILYAFLSDNFRKSFSKAFTCMAGHEVNAQLQVEPSVFTKHGGSRRRSSKRLVAQTTSAKHKAAGLQAHHNPNAMGNNNSSTTTSSTATRENEKNTVVVNSSGGGAGTTTTSGGSSLGVGHFHDATNGRVDALVTTATAENVMLVFDKEETVCATVVERKNARHQTNLGSTLQTDL